MTSFYFQGLRKCFLEISIRLEVLLAALFISVSNRYQKKTICFSRLGNPGGGGGGGGGNLGVILVRVCEPIFQNLPHSYTWPSKNGPIHILDHPKC